jgi:hypothetical protein
MTDSQSLHHAVGYHISSLEPDAPIYWAAGSISDTARVEDVQISETRVERLPSDDRGGGLLSTLRRLNIGRDDSTAHTVISVPALWVRTEGSEEMKSVMDTMEQLDLDGDSYFRTVDSRRVMSHARIQLGLREGESRMKVFNDLSIEIGPSVVECEVNCWTVEDEGATRTTEVFRRACGAAIEEVLECVRVAASALNESPTAAGSEIQHVFILSLPEPQSEELVKSLTETSLPSILPSSTAYHTDLHLEQHATKLALEDVYSCLHRDEIYICVFTVTRLPLGIMLADGKIRTIMEQNRTVPTCKAFTFIASAETASLILSMGGPATRQEVGMLKVDGTKPGMKLKFEFSLDYKGETLNISASEVSDLGEVVKILARTEMGLQGGMRRKEFQRYVREACHDNGDEVAKAYEILPA